MSLVKKNMIIPSHLQIETINGSCTSRCIMCTRSTWTRKPRRMTEEEFTIILKRFLPYRDNLRYLTLHGWGEPLLDRGLPKKIKIAKDMGFRGTGLATNCTELDVKLSVALLESGLDTLICSVDGLTKETHESIRVGTNFDSIVNNVQTFIKLRPEHGRTRVLVRFIRQKANEHEWPEFKKYWEEHIDKAMGDAVIKFDVHNVADNLENFANKDVLADEEVVVITCEDFNDRISIHSNGEVGLCVADSNGFFQLGNVLYEEPMSIFNNEIFTRYRNMMKQGRFKELEHCCNCTIPRSRMVKDKVKDD